MSRTGMMSQLRRAARLAAFCDTRRLPTQEGIEQAIAQDRQRWLSRRAFLGASGSALALGALSGATGCLTDESELRTSEGSLRLTGDIAVVGAGLAGLACADRLRFYSLAATVYEASDRVGGRCYSMGGSFPGPVEFPGQVVKRGGELIDTLHTTMRGYARELGLEMEDLTREPGEIFYYFNGTHYSEAQVVDEYRALVPALQADLRTLGEPTADSFTPADEALDFMNLADYLDSRGAGSLIRKVIAVAYTIEYGLDIHQQSCLNLLFFIHADRRSTFKPFGVFSDERFHVRYGNEAIPRGLAARLLQPVTFGHRLVAVHRTASGRIALTFDTPGGSVTRVHDAAVLTVPFSVLRDVQLDASLGMSAAKRYAIDNLKYGTNSKLMVGFDRRVWHDDYGSNGTAYTDRPYLQNCWETNYANATSTRAVLTDYTGGNLGASLNPRNPQRDVTRFLDELDRVYPGAKGAATRTGGGPSYRAHLEHWPSNPLSKGSYTSNQPGYFTTIAGNEAKPVGPNLFFAGEHTDSFYEWQGFMEGAANSGLRAAGEVVAFLRGR
jgi:monoamine oxidase